MQIEFLELAQKELDDAFEYYESQQTNLGYHFLSEVQNALGLIKTYPHAWSKFSKNTRRCLLKRFPYGIIYQKRDTTILVIAIANLHKKPNYWAKRVT